MEEKNTNHNLYDLPNDDVYIALKRAAKNKEGQRHKERMSKKPALIARDYY